MEIDREYIRNALRKLVSINSINPNLVSGAPGEADIAHFIATEIERMGIEPVKEQISLNRFNVSGTISGTGGGKSLLLNAHIDTVGVDGMSEPFSAKEYNGRLYGRGALDMKGGAAAILGAAKVIKDQAITLKGDLLLTFVADEEYGSIGTEALLKDIHADAAIVTEPTNLAICTAHKGFALFEIETKGVAAHGSGYQGGVDANTHMARIAVELEKLQGRLYREKKHPLLGSPTIHIPLISGGTQLFMYSSRCTMKVERRTLPGETEEDVLNEISRIIKDLKEIDSTFEANSKLEILRNPFCASDDSRIVQEVEKILSKLIGMPPSYIGHHWWEDSALFSEAGIDTVIIGPKGEGLHQKVEWVDIQSVENLASILALTAINYCGEHKA